MCLPICCGRHRRWCSDEVYEHMIYDGEVYASIVGHLSVRARRRGVLFRQDDACHRLARRYTVASEEVTREIRRVHQFNTQYRCAVAVRDRRFLKASPEHNSQSPISASATVSRLPAQPSFS
jgi:hypothetical protein